MGREVRIEYLIAPEQWKVRGHCSPEYICVFTDLSGRVSRSGAMGPHRAVEVLTGEVLQLWATDAKYGFKL